MKSINQISSYDELLNLYPNTKAALFDLASSGWTNPKPVIWAILVGEFYEEESEIPHTQQGFWTDAKNSLPPKSRTGAEWAHQQLFEETESGEPGILFDMIFDYITTEEKQLFVDVFNTAMKMFDNQ